ncbi:hypothetical protein HMPREF9141_0093 [Prevotella multiformis DSM 16608]|uniref:Uncharacterized protein n=1 Tax=Prevotella multiformis DSM 16608 TaxID=888743 RepID=F0F3C7_9BACT|nr:hypothetical protein HMPREF9141_0093 [Prevotella multiformis DSM 16608]
MKNQRWGGHIEDIEGEDVFAEAEEDSTFLCNFAKTGCIRQAGSHVFPAPAGTVFPTTKTKDDDRHIQYGRDP